MSLTLIIEEKYTSEFLEEMAKDLGISDPEIKSGFDSVIKEAGRLYLRSIEPKNVLSKKDQQFLTDRIAANIDEIIEDYKTLSTVPGFEVRLITNMYDLRKKEHEKYEPIFSMIFTPDVIKLKLIKIIPEFLRDIYHLAKENKKYKSSPKSVAVAWWVYHIHQFWDTHLPENPLSQGKYYKEGNFYKGGSVDDLFRIISQLDPNVTRSMIANGIKTSREERLKEHDFQGH